jgi:alanyl-tRNA synthetase
VGGGKGVLHAQVDPEWRIGARQAHSGTHVVHAALREVLGPTALQSGSYNRPGYLRLDFGWTTGLTPGQFSELEEVANNTLRADLPVSWDYMTLSQAKEWGAIALFGETYDDSKVRVVEIGGPWSRELCGGTHVDHSSQIGTIVLTGEASVGSGNRRIEALTGVEGFRYLARERDVVRQLTDLLKAQAADDVVGRVADLMDRLKTSEKELEKIRVGQLLASAGRFVEDAVDIDGVAVVAARAAGASGGDVRTLATDIRGRFGERPAVVVLIGDGDGKVSVVTATNEGARARGLSANDLLRGVSPVVGGKGGGKDDLAQGGGSDASRIDEALALVPGLVAGV